MVYAHVINRKTGLERKNVSVAAYELAKRKYDLKGYVDENGNPVDGPGPNGIAPPQKKREEAAAPVVVKPKLTAEEIAAKKAEIEAVNQKAIDAAVAEADPEVKEKKKPGPKPKKNA